MATRGNRATDYYNIAPESVQISPAIPKSKDGNNWYSCTFSYKTENGEDRKMANISTCLGAIYLSDNDGKTGALLNFSEEHSEDSERFREWNAGVLESMIKGLKVNHASFSKIVPKTSKIDTLTRGFTFPDEKSNSDVDTLFYGKITLKYLNIYYLPATQRISYEQAKKCSIKGYLVVSFSHIYMVKDKIVPQIFCNAIVITELCERKVPMPITDEMQKYMTNLSLEDTVKKREELEQLLASLENQDDGDTKEIREARGNQKAKKDGLDGKSFHKSGSAPSKFNKSTLAIQPDEEEAESDFASALGDDE